MPYSSVCDHTVEIVTTSLECAAMYGIVRQKNRDRLYYLLIWPPVCLVARVLLSPKIVTDYGRL